VHARKPISIDSVTTAPVAPTPSVLTAPPVITPRTPGAADSGSNEDGLSDEDTLSSDCEAVEDCTLPAPHEEHSARMFAQGVWRAELKRPRRTAQSNWQFVASQFVLTVDGRDYVGSKAVITLAPSATK
jgi:hypothetical protein